MKFVRNKIGLVIVLTIMLSVGVPRASDTITTSVLKTNSIASNVAGEVTGVPYVWQEINGFCMWAAVSMALQHVGVPLDLYGLFAASGIGFSASYLRYEENLLFMPGAFFRQTMPLDIVSSLYGLNSTMYMDASTELGVGMREVGVNYTSINGWGEALSFLKRTIDSGYPLVLWTDPYYLPHDDYDIARELGISFDISHAGHAVVVVGYNDTSGTAQIKDPGIGAFGENFGYPSHGSWYYDINYTSLRNTWGSLAYGAFLIKPGTGKVDDFTLQLATYTIERLRGDRSSYLPDIEEDIFFWNFGADAFRGMAYDLTAEGLSSLMDDLEISDPAIKSIVLTSIGLQYEGFLSIQYLSYRTAIRVLPILLPTLDLDEFVRVGQEALHHFESISDNSTMIELDYLGGATIMTDTLCSIASSCISTTSGDVHTAAAEYDDDLNQIREHLMEIADVWDAAADALDTALQGDGTMTVVVISSGIVGIVVLVVVFIRRRSSI
ncbi:MAG: BtrH N-terminal domain-containing protein [Candidatus Thorarchaeota archaeon]|jgi:hypothetical protein